MRNPNWPNILRRAGNAGRKAILENYTESNRHKITGRGTGGDMTLRIDKVSERAIFKSLKNDLGDSFVFLSEEVGEVSKAGRVNEQTPVVVCDPLDGSHNAQVGIPLFSLALSLIEPGKLGTRDFGKITNSFITSIKTEDEYYAVKGRGSFHNGKKLKSYPNPSSDEIHTLLVETSDIDYLRDIILGKLSKKDALKIRLLGGAALSYCMLADGTAEALIFAQPGGARTIDSPAGILIAKEAGRVFSNLAEGSEESKVDNVEIGFTSRLNVVGAVNSSILAKLEKKLGTLP